MGRVSLEGMEFYARHGYYEEERKIGNKYSVDVHLEVNLEAAAETDRLEGTVNYERVYDLVAEVMGMEAMLLEHLAGKIIKELKRTFPKVNKVTVEVSKYNPPIKGLCRRAVVRMEG